MFKIKKKHVHDFKSSRLIQKRGLCEPEPTSAPFIENSKTTTEFTRGNMSCYNPSYFEGRIGFDL
jgi:hypothetical protein